VRLLAKVTLCFVELTIISMITECEDGSCCITKEDYNKLDYKSKYIITMSLLRMEEAENQMLWNTIGELEKANNPIVFTEKIKLRLRIFAGYFRSLS